MSDLHVRTTASTDRPLAHHSRLQRLLRHQDSQTPLPTLRSSRLLLTSDSAATSCFIRDCLNTGCSSADTHTDSTAALLDFLHLRV